MSLIRRTVNTKTFDALLEEIEALPVERQETLAEILHHRLAETRRKEIARNAREARDLFEKGQLPCGSVDELMRDLGAGETQRGPYPGRQASAGPSGAMFVAIRICENEFAR